MENNEFHEEFSKYRKDSLMEEKKVCNKIPQHCKQVKNLRFKKISSGEIIPLSFDFSPAGSPAWACRRGSEGGQAEAAGKQSSLLNKEQQQLYCTVYGAAYPRELLRYFLWRSLILDNFLAAN